MRDSYLERFLDPWREFEQMGRLLGVPGSANEFPAVNVWANEDEAIVTTELPGVDSDALDISVTGDTLTIRGSRPLNETKEGETCHRHELWHGTFSKTIELPFNADAEKVEASYTKGIVKITLPRLEAEKPKKIKINT